MILIHVFLGKKARDIHKKILGSHIGESVPRNLLKDKNI